MRVSDKFITALLLLLPVATASAMAGGGPRALNYPAIASFMVFIITTLFITVYAARRTRSRKDFYVAGNTIGGLQNGIAISGDYMSAASFLGLVGLLFIGGYDVIYFVVNLILSWAVVLLLIAEKLRNLGSYTFADAVSVRLAARPIRILAATGTLAVAVPYLLAQMVAAGALVESLFGLSYTQGVFIVGVLMTIYVTFGGMIATTWVQIIKAALLVGGGTILAVSLIILGPTVWVNVLGYAEPVFPYTYPTLFSMGACFLFTWFFSITDNSPRAAAEADAFAEQMRRSQVGELSHG